jgi:oligoendopeptidase F
MTFGGTAASTMTLAHELGHTYHNHVLEQLPLLAQNTPLNLAETASTFAETIVLDAAIAQASSPAERLALLDGKMREAIASLMNIRARFLFEVRFHRERRQGPVGVRDLNRWMEEAQREAFGDDLQSYYPLLWASTRHFYRTQPPFYNFPYAFGYLFSLSIYARAREEGPAFASRYADLLRDTGRMYAEELARRHLGADLTRPAFWNAGIQMVLADVDEFMRLTEESGRKRAGPA